jgi:choice-of-anchor C domain-containing protein
MGVATAALGASPALAAGNFTNGNFGYYPGTAAFQTLYAGTPSATAIPGWTVTSGSVDWINTYWQQPSGVAPALSIDLNGTPTAAHPNPVGSISQTFATTPGQEYEVGFSYAGNPVCGPSTKGMTVSVNGSVIRHYSFSTASTTTSNMGWTYDLYNFWVADASGTTTLTFAADPSNTSNCGFVISQVYAGTPEASVPPGFENP